MFTGLSGSAKSSLAFDTIYAEGQRRYVKSPSAYARQFLKMMQKPDIDQIDGLSPIGYDCNARLAGHHRCGGHGETLALQGASTVVHQVAA